MTDAPSGPAKSPPAPPADRHPASRVTRLPYVLVVVVALVAAMVWGALTLRARFTAEQEMIGVGDDPAVYNQAIPTAPSR